MLPVKLKKDGGFSYSAASKGDSNSMNPSKMTKSGRHAGFFQRHTALVLLLFTAICLSLLFIATEIVLRKHFKYIPGVLDRGHEFHETDSLFLFNDYYTDSTGMFVSNPNVFEMRGIKCKNCRINSDGFRGREFSEAPTDSNTKRVLMIGDSFLWGGAAHPLDNAFADRVDRLQRYQCYNTGIPGADPAQYELIAERYIPRLQPNAVCLFFYMGNDIMWSERQPKPYTNLYYWTNAGALMGYRPTWIDGLPNETFDSPQQAYDYMMDNITLKGKNADTFTKICGTTAISTILWSVATQKKRIRKLKYKRPPQPISGKYLKRIKQICQNHNVPLLLFVIPSIEKFEKNTKQIVRQYPTVFEGFELLAPPQLLPDYYRPLPNGHLNNIGHRVYADYITEQLDRLEIAGFGLKNIGKNALFSHQKAFVHSWLQK